MRSAVLFFTLLVCFSVLPKAYGDDGLSLPDVFILELHKTAADGPFLSAPLGLNEELVVTSQVPQLGSPNAPVLANIIWQLYTEAGKPLPQFNKTRQIIGLGQQEFCSFVVRAGQLANGRYFIALTHQLAADPTSFYQASVAIDVHQPLAIKEVVIDESPQGKSNQPTFYEDQSPHIFVYYYLATDVYTALVQIDVLDEQGTIRASRTFFKDRDFKKKRERVGIKLPPGLFKAGEKALVKVSVSTPDDITVTAESSFQVLAIDLGVNLPDHMVQGTITDFQLFVPQTFNGPFRVEFEHIDGFIYKVQEGELSGKFFVTPVASLGVHTIVVSVTDNSGNRATGEVSVTVEQGAVPSYQRPNRPVNSRPGGHIGSSTRR